MALPPIILALSLMAAVGQSVNNVILALTILLTPTAARTVRSVALGDRGRARTSRRRGRRAPRTVRIVLRHILPNCLATYIVLVTTNISYAIVVEASLSFLGVGAPPDEPSWGGMLTAGVQAIETAPWLIFFPGVAISLAVFALNLLGDAIRDIADPTPPGRSRLERDTRRNCDMRTTRIGSASSLVVLVVIAARRGRRVGPATSRATAAS